MLNCQLVDTLTMYRVVCSDAAVDGAKCSLDSDRNQERIQTFALTQKSPLQSLQWQAAGTALNCQTQHARTEDSQAQGGHQGQCCHRIYQ
jgi:hypothetical protein